MGRILHLLFKEKHLLNKTLFVFPLIQEKVYIHFHPHGICKILKDVGVCMFCLFVGVESTTVRKRAHAHICPFWRCQLQLSKLFSFLTQTFVHKYIILLKTGIFSLLFPCIGQKKTIWIELGLLLKNPGYKL